MLQTSVAMREIAIMPNAATDHFVRCGIRELAAFLWGGKLALMKGEADEAEHQ